MNKDKNIDSLIEEVDAFLSVVKNEGLEQGKQFYVKTLKPKIEKIKNTNLDYYNKNAEYFIEIYEMSYVHPNFSNPFRNPEEPISVITEIFKIEFKASR